MSDLIWPWHVPPLGVLIVFKMFDFYPRQEYIVIWPRHVIPQHVLHLIFLNFILARSLGVYIYIYIFGTLRAPN
jgi:hypothetical protein